MPAKMSLERIAKALTEALNADETTMHLALQTQLDEEGKTWILTARGTLCGLRRWRR